MYSSPLPDYSIRVSRRARRVILRALPGKGLEVVLPERADPACVPDLVRRNLDWIDRALARIPAASVAANGPDLALTEIVLAGGRERVVLRPLSRSGNRSQGLAPTDREAGHPCAGLCPQTSCFPQDPAPGAPLVCRPLPVPGHLLKAPEHLAQLRAFLREWLREEARTRFAPLLRQAAKEHGLEQKTLSLRFQRTRWGSCSRRGGISLNACLLFLPERLVRHVILHELCHTRHMNHGEGFWKLLFALEPDALIRDRELRGAWRYVPTWVMESR